MPLQILLLSVNQSFGPLLFCGVGNGVLLFTGAGGMFIVTLQMG